VLNMDRELLIFPLLSGISTLVIIASFVMPVLWSGSGNIFNSMGNSSETTIYVVMFLFYFVTYSITYFFNTAVISCAIYRMKGGDPDVAGGFRAAWSNIMPILGWALLSATIGMVLRFIQNKSNLLGKIVVGIIGVAWSVASYLVIPVIIMEKKGPIDALKVSGSLVKSTWGEQIAGNLGIGFAMVLVMIPAFILIPLFALSSSQTVLMTGFSLFFVYVILISLVQSTLTSIYQAALYLYAREDYVPEGYSRRLMQQSIQA
jgi:hypothetical protein